MPGMHPNFKAYLSCRPGTAAVPVSTFLQIPMCNTVFNWQTRIKIVRKNQQKCGSAELISHRNPQLPTNTFRPRPLDLGFNIALKSCI